MSYSDSGWWILITDDPLRYAMTVQELVLFVNNPIQGDSSTTVKVKPVESAPEPPASVATSSWLIPPAVMVITFCRVVIYRTCSFIPTTKTNISALYSLFACLINIFWLPLFSPCTTTVFPVGFMEILSFPGSASHSNNCWSIALPLYRFTCAVFLLPSSISITCAGTII